MKKIFICFTIALLSLALLSNMSCADNPDIFKPPAQATNEADPKALNPGSIPKTQGYNFTEGFIFHEWKNQEAIIKYVPFYFRDWKEYNGSLYLTSSTWAIKKLVSSKYFDIYVDCTEGQPTYKKSLTVQDKVWDKLIRELEKLYPKIVDIYGEPTDVDGNGKIEIVFHENEYMIKNGYAGYFNYKNVSKKYYRTGEMDILYINSGLYIQRNMNEFPTGCIDTIVHELQHDIDAKRNPYSAEYCFNEGLSLSTYFIIHNGSGSGRTTDFRSSEIANGQYFFNWPQNGELITGNYQTAAYFMYWLYLHGGGEKIIRDIASVSEYKQIDYKSVVEAASRNIPDLKNQNHDTLISLWYKANFYNNNSGIYGYKGKAKISLSLANDPSGKVILKPRCAVYTTQDMLDKNKNIPLAVEIGYFFLITVQMIGRFI